MGVTVGCLSPAPDERQMVDRPKTWQWLLALSSLLGNKAERVERRKAQETENWPLGNGSRSPGVGRRGLLLQGARGR
jgi:hypothetical protein